MPVTARSRYAGCATVDAHGRPSLALRPPPALDSTGCAIHVLVGGEALDELAFAYYGRAELWWLIADANPRTPRGEASPFAWRAGDRLVIPPVTAAGRVGRG